MEKRLFPNYTPTMKVRLALVKKIVLLLSSVMLTAMSFGQQTWKVEYGGILFSQPPFKNCHASTIVEGPDGQFSVACFAGTEEGNKDVGIYYGKIGTDKKIVPTEVANGIINDTSRYPCWNPVLLNKKDGQMVLFYKVGPNPRDWWGVYKTSNDNGKTWSGSVNLPKGILGPIKNKAILFDNGDILCPSSFEQANGRWKVFIEKTDKKLSKWTVVPVDTSGSFDVIQPSILSYGGNKLQILCRSKQGNVIQSWSLNNGKTWSELSRTSLLNPNSGTDAVTLKDGRQLIVYNPTKSGKEWFNGRAKLRVAISSNGTDWQDIVELENGTKEEYSYPAVIQSADGRIHITYTYDRKNIKYVILKES